MKVEADGSRIIYADGPKRFDANRNQSSDRYLLSFLPLILGYSEILYSLASIVRNERDIYDPEGKLEEFLENF